MQNLQSKQEITKKKKCNLYRISKVPEIIKPVKPMIAKIPTKTQKKNVLYTHEKQPGRMFLYDLFWIGQIGNINIIQKCYAYISTKK